MPDINIHRAHGMSLAQAREAADKWIVQAEQKFGLSCVYEAGEQSDEVVFNRAGISGKLNITPEMFELNAKLGFLFGAFKEKIETEITKNLDALIAKMQTEGSAQAATQKG
jgi:putative polyhydroxyalkanoate system protein